MEEMIFARPIGYKLVEFLGEGLNSCVYRAIKETEQHGVKFEVALKILKSEKSVEIWRNEFDRLSRLRSQFCVGLLGWEFICDRPTLVLEYVRGVTLAELVSSHLTINTNEWHEILFQAHSGLKDLSAERLYHGDLNFHNIMIEATGAVKLVDFGIYNAEVGRMTTLEFASPEIINGSLPSFESDLFSLVAISREISKRKNCELMANFEKYEPNLASRASLGLKTQELLNFKKRILGKTQEIHLTKNERSHYTQFLRIALMTFVLFLSVLSKGDQFQYQPDKNASISVRTSEWTKIVINHQTIGFSPIDLKVVPQKKILLNWVNAKGEYQSSLTLDYGQHIILNDEYFKEHTEAIIEKRRKNVAGQ